MEHTEVVIIGGGIAGTSMAYHLASQGMKEVILLEREDTFGFHSSGRSAAVLNEASANDVMMPLTLKSSPFLRNPPNGFSEHPITRPTGILVLESGSRWLTLKVTIPIVRRAGITVEKWEKKEVISCVPVLDPEYFDGSIFLPESGTIDIHELLWGYIRGARKHGVQFKANSEVTAIRVTNGEVNGVVTPHGEIAARWVVNAGGPGQTH